MTPADLLGLAALLAAWLGRELTPLVLAYRTAKRRDAAKASKEGPKS